MNILEKIDGYLKEAKIKIGDRVKVTGGGVDDGSTGTVINSKQIKTDGRGVPELTGHYKPVDWSKEIAIKKDNGEIITMFKTHVKVI